MSRSRNKLYRWRCSCCRHATKYKQIANKGFRKLGKQKLSISECLLPKFLDHSLKRRTKGGFKVRFMYVETKEYVREKSKILAEYYGKTDKERLALEKKFYYRMIGK